MSERREVDPAPRSGPPLVRGVALAHDDDADARVLGLDHPQLVAEDDVGGRAGVVHEHDVDRLARGVDRAQHRHQRRDAAAGGEEEVPLGRVVRGAEAAQRTVDGDGVAGPEVVVQPARHRPAGHPLDGDRELVGPPGRRRDRVAAADRLPVDGHGQREVLPRLEPVRRGLGRPQHEAAHVVRDVVDRHADQRVVEVVAPVEGWCDVDERRGEDGGRHRARYSLTRSTYQVVKASTWYSLGA